MASENIDLPGFYPRKIGVTLPVQSLAQRTMEIPVYDSLYILAMLALVLWISDWLARKPVFRAFGIALLVIILTAVLANLGILPASSNPVYDGIFAFVAPIALFLLLLDVHFGQLKKVGFPILIIFLMGSLGTVLGVFAALLMVKDQPYFDGVYHALAGMFAGTYTGGSINFNAVALHYRVVENSILYTGAVAVDNVITTAWFFITVALPVGMQRLLPRSLPSGAIKAEAPEPGLPADERGVLSLKSLSVWIGLGCLSLFVVDTISSALGQAGITIPSILLLTTLALGVAQVPAISRLKGNMLLGSWGIYLFLAVVGAYCDLGALREAGDVSIALLIFVSVTVLVHGLFIFGVNLFTKYDWQLIAIASQANIGGGTTAMALAKNFKRNELILPAIIIGSVGNALGTYIGFMVAGLL